MIEQKKNPHLREVTEDNWKPIHTKILMYHQQGIDYKIIAKKVRVTERTIQNVVRSPTFKKRIGIAITTTTEIIAKRQAEKSIVCKAREELDKAAFAAARKIKKIMRSGENKHRMQFDAAKEILHIAGIKPIEVLETRERDYSPEEIESAKQTLIEIVEMTKQVSSPDEQFLLRSPGKPELGSKDTPSHTTIKSKVITQQSIEPPIKEEIKLVEDKTNE